MHVQKKPMIWITGVFEFIDQINACLLKLLSCSSVGTELDFEHPPGSSGILCIKPFPSSYTWFFASFATSGSLVEGTSGFSLSGLDKNIFGLKRDLALAWDYWSCWLYVRCLFIGIPTVSMGVIKSVPRLVGITAWPQQCLARQNFLPPCFSVDLSVYGDDTEGVLSCLSFWQRLIRQLLPYFTHNWFILMNTLPVACEDYESSTLPWTFRGLLIIYYQKASINDFISEFRNHTLSLYE